MKTLLLCDDYWHPGEVPINGVKPLESKGYEFDIVSDGADFSPAMLSDYDSVMLCKCNQKTQAEDVPWMTYEIQESFVRYVEDGGGLLTVHSGTVPSKSTQTMSELIGCRFTFHPDICPVTVAPLVPHPITDGVELFCEVDEHYRLSILDGNARVILASYSAPQGNEGLFEEDPYHNTAAWLGAAGLIKTHGKGRVCVLTPGHTPEVWANSEFQKLLDNSLTWCGR